VQKRTLLSEIEKQINHREIEYSVCLDHFRDLISQDIAKDWTLENGRDTAYQVISLLWKEYSSFEFKCFVDKEGWSRKDLSLVGRGYLSSM
jgi:hypothetical protein